MLTCLYLITSAVGRCDFYFPWHQKTKKCLATRQYMFAYSQLFEETVTHHNAVCTVMHHQQLSGQMRQRVNINTNWRHLSTVYRIRPTCTGCSCGWQSGN